MCGTSFIILASLVLSGCGPASSDNDAASAGVGTPEQRGALFDTIYARTERREAFSPAKNAALGYDPMQEMRAVRPRFLAAETDVDLFYAIAAASHARRDRHLDLLLAPNGLELPDSAGLEFANGDEIPLRQAPVRIFPDFGTEAIDYFVGDRAHVEGVAVPEVGDRVVEVNGLEVSAWHGAVTAYMRHSSTIGLQWKLAEAMGQDGAGVPPELRSTTLDLVVEAGDGSQREYSLPYGDPESLAFDGVGEPTYPGTRVAMTTATFDLYVPTEPTDYVVLLWRGFRETMVPDVDALVEFASAEGLLDRALIMDVTRSRGGSLGPYAMQRLQPQSFRTTFGNLRLSDVIMPFVEDKRADFAARNINDSGVREIIDDGSWLMEWLEDDVVPGLERGDDYSTNVPFKSAHAPKDSDGVLDPAPIHFRGPLVVISGPSGGSHLDQWNSIVADNDLGVLVGMPAGGYSNTWEWDETLTLPGTDRPLVNFMWNIGHSLRPNGEILEGNPAVVDEWIPLTADNVETYYATLLERALAHAGSRR